MRRRVKIGRRREVESPEIIVIPMIDVMMFLLFFFMVASLAMVVQAGLPVNLPKASNTQQHSSQNITITITSSGEVFLNTTRTTLGQLADGLKRIGATSDNLVIINADRSTNYGYVINAISEAGKAGITRFTFATEKA
ncbi:MAG TPA: biopolymer transporter ExbD [Fimbriimonadaceae bacterium]|nr:biopolymer transporter ExbD [Fimbriimonadaceae bacterium]